MTRVFVPDASVILKWVLPPHREPEVEAAVAVLDRFVTGDITLAVPALWYFEVGNTVARLVPDAAQRYLSRLRALGMAEVPIGAVLERRILSIVREFGVTFYDAAYHASALEIGGLLVTADIRYRARVGGDSAVVTLAEATSG